MRCAVPRFGDGAVACSPLPFEVGQIPLKDLLCAFNLQQQLLCRFSVATAVLQLFDVLSLPVDYLTTPLDMTTGKARRSSIVGTA